MECLVEHYERQIAHNGAKIADSYESLEKSEHWGVYHLTENFGNSGWKVNGKTTFRKFQPKIEE